MFYNRGICPMLEFFSVPKDGSNIRRFPTVHVILESIRLVILLTGLNPKVFSARKRSLGQGNIFRSVCQEFCPQGGVPDQVHPPGPGR